MGRGVNMVDRMDQTHGPGHWAVVEPGSCGSGTQIELIKWLVALRLVLKNLKAIPDQFLSCCPMLKETIRAGRERKYLLHFIFYIVGRSSIVMQYSLHFTFYIVGHFSIVRCIICDTYLKTKYIFKYIATIYNWKCAE